MGNLGIDKMIYDCWNILITHVHIQASMGSTDAKVTEVIGDFLTFLKPEHWLRRGADANPAA